MSIAAQILGSAPVSLWGLDPRERVERQLRAAGVTLVVDDAGGLASDSMVVLVDAGYLLEVRTLRGLLERPGSLLVCDDDRGVAAAFVPASRAPALARWMRDGGEDRFEDVTRLGPRDLESFDGDLRRTEPPLLRRIEPGEQAALEDLLYGNAYKGITDLVTKWLWPRPAKAVVRWCAHRGITPNMITLAGLGLVIAASVLFAHGRYAVGLACGWLMALLDTVDGKLARVTVSSSRLGHVLDHGMDIIHPPFWYVLWGVGLTHFEPVLGLEREALYAMIVWGYIAGRAIEALFHALGRCSLFAWRPFDAYFRLITARRNPCLVLLTVSVLIGRPDWGLVAVALWTTASSLVMLVRLLQAVAARLRHGPLESWLQHPDRAAARHPHAYQTFSGTRAAYG